MNDRPKNKKKLGLKRITVANLSGAAGGTLGPLVNIATKLTGRIGNLTKTAEYQPTYAGPTPTQPALCPTVGCLRIPLPPKKPNTRGCLIR